MLCYAKSLQSCSTLCDPMSLQSCPTLCDPIDGSHQAPPSRRFSRQEHWSGLPFPSPMHELKVKSESEVAQLCPTPSDPMDYSPPGSSIHGTLKARVLEWGAIAFSDCVTRTPYRLLQFHRTSLKGKASSLSTE